MNVIDQIRLVVYRIHEKGLEVLMIDQDEQYRLPEAVMAPFTQKELEEEGRIITLEDGMSFRAVCIEGEWHDIPSIRGLIKGDLEMVKHKIFEVVPEIDQGSYVAVKEVFKKVLPREYAILKELKDVLMMRNVTQNI